MVKEVTIKYYSKYYTELTHMLLYLQKVGGYLQETGILLENRKILVCLVLSFSQCFSLSSLVVYQVTEEPDNLNCLPFFFQN